MCVCVYVCARVYMYILMYIYPEARSRTPKARSPIPNNYSGYTSGRILPGAITLRLVPGRAESSGSYSPEPEPEQLIGLFSPAIPTRPDPGQKTPIPNSPEIAPYSNPNKFKHPEPE